MTPLAKDLQTPKHSLDDFSSVAERVLAYLPNIVSEKRDANAYTILSSGIAGTLKYARPIKKDLFISDSDEFRSAYHAFLTRMDEIKQRQPILKEKRHLIDSVVYTIQQSIGVGMDFLCNPNSARKHVGNRFEELIRLIITQIGLTNDKIVLKIPYPFEDRERIYSCEIDIVISPHQSLNSGSQGIAEDELVVSLKTTSKDRMGKIFIDKLLMERFTQHPVKVVGLFLNDVQRKGKDKINYTFVSGLFMVYTKFLRQLEGLYFIDPPPVADLEPYKQHISPFSKFITEDIWTFLAP